MANQSPASHAHIQQPIRQSHDPTIQSQHAQKGPKYSSRVSFGTWPGTLISINFPQNFPLALIGCSGAPASFLAWGLQLLVGSHTV